MTDKKIVVLGLLGPVLDNGRGTERWERWRPTVSICQHDDLLVHRFELLYEAKFQSLCDTVSKDIAAISPETTVCPHQVEMKDPWDFEEVYGALLDFAKRYPFKPDEEEYLVHITTGSHVAQICLFILTEARYLPARLIQTSPPNKNRGKAGAYDIVDLDLSKYDRLATRFHDERRESTSFLKNGIQTRNKRFNQLVDQIEHVAVGSKSPILLMGPTGAGKSQLAKKIYELKKQRRQVEGKLIEVNCATIRGDGAMSALFGHTRGAFTGAVGERAVYCVPPTMGYYFSDEVAELGLDEQAMLLRAIEERRFLPVGSDKDVTSDFQLIAGTNADLLKAVRKGTFREDLLARINLWTFQLPGLRDRREDIEPNLDYELDQYARLHGKKVTFNKESRELFLKFATAPDSTWSGNFRDLNAAVTRMSTFASSGRITVDIVQSEMDRLKAFWTEPQSTTPQIDLSQILTESNFNKLDPFDAIQLAEVVRICQQSRTLSEAGRTLFATSRKNKSTPNDADRLKKYLARFGLEWANMQSKQNP